MIRLCARRRSRLSGPTRTALSARGAVSRWRTARPCSRLAAGATSITTRYRGSRSTSRRTRCGAGRTAAADTLEREAGEHRETAIVLLRLACCHAQLGQHELAWKELRQALAINPRMRSMAEGDELLTPLREASGWVDAIG